MNTAIHKVIKAFKINLIVIHKDNKIRKNSINQIINHFKAVLINLKRSRIMKETNQAKIDLK
jgi:hypothetical protein